MLLYRLLLYLYPSAWRSEYAGEMCSIFDSRRRNAGGPFSRLAIWLEIFPDL